jgi:CheY-like chemotaxis protein
VIEIEDTGPGIAPNDVAHVFEPFGRGSSSALNASGRGSFSTALAPSGTGLGLTISKMLTDLMGGEISVISPTSAQASGGSLFRIRLFLPELTGVRVEREPPRAARSGYLGVRRKLLVVDNEESDRELLIKLLEPLGFELRSVASGQACLDWLGHAPSGDLPDAILMDLAMPGIDGWATVRALRQHQLSSAPVAIVSGNAFDKGLDNDVGISVDDFILKPVRPRELLDWLGSRLNLQWTQAAGSQALPSPEASSFVAPDLHQLQALNELVGLGYYRGMVRKLDEIDGMSTSHAAFVQHLRGLARDFQLEAMAHFIQKFIDVGTGKQAEPT